MNTTINQVATGEVSLPQLVKKPTTYKIKVPKNVEEKIRYLIRKFPSTEWSGVLFYDHTGEFEDGSLEIHCKDIFPMDIGSGTFTDFKMDESVVGYIAENIELFGCDTGLCHSHHSMGAYFSGTDTSTLRSEGNDTNCFVSLIVDTKGTYCAAITRKVQAKKEVTTKFLGTSYEFFGEGNKHLEGPDTIEKQTVVEDTIIEYFMLDMEVEHVDNPLGYLDTRFDEIEKKKSEARNSLPQGIFNDIGAKGKPNDFYDWIHSNRNISAKTKENLLPDRQLELFEEGDDYIEDWKPDKIAVHTLVCRMITCSMFISKDTDLKQWIAKYMEKGYDRVFGQESVDDCSGLFEQWVEFIVEFLLYSYPTVSKDDVIITTDTMSSIASAMCDELDSYPENKYLETYKSILKEYIYE